MGKDKKLRIIILIAVTLIALYLCWLMLLPFINVLVWAAVLVILFFPTHRRIRARLKRETLAAALSCLLVLLIVVVPLALVLYLVVNEATSETQNLQSMIESLLNPNSRLAERILNWANQYVDLSRARLHEFLIGRLQYMSSAIAQNSIGYVGDAFHLIMQLLFVIFTMYYFFRDGERIYQGLFNALPLPPKQAKTIMARTRDVISASLYGMLVIALMQGILGGFAFWFLGINSPLLWGAVMFVVSVIPMFGSFLVWVPTAIILLLTGHWGKALILTAWGTVVIGSVDNFLRPKLIGEKTRLHELLIFFSVLGGLQVFGIAGIILGPLTVAITLALIEILKQSNEPSSSRASVIKTFSRRQPTVNRRQTFRQ